MTRITRIFTDEESGEQIKTLPLMTLITRILTDIFH
jgi:hypothetical protein